jgi:hypothetical protein
MSTAPRCKGTLCRISVLIAGKQGDQISLRNICPIWDRCYDFKSFFAKNSAKLFALFAQTTATFGKNLIITLVLEKKRQFFSPKIGKNRRKIVFIASTPGHTAGKSGPN